MNASPTFAAPDVGKSELEEGAVFRPRFGADGLIPAVMSDAASGEILMFAWMNEQALALTLDTGLAHFWTRSRKRIWKKGEESGNLLQVIEIRTDCDQDVIWLKTKIMGDGLACHTGRRSCFYRVVRSGGDDGGWSLAVAE